MKGKSLNIIIISICSLISINKVIAQTDFRSGYIITNTLDTIRGYLLYRDISSKKCTFKKSPDDKSINYSPGDILAYRFDNGKYYISKETPLSTGNKVLFLEYLIKGKASVYFMKDDSEHYFIETDTTKIIELSEPEKLVIKEESTYIKPSLFKGKLKFILSNCPEIYPEIDKMTLDNSSLVKLAKDYHTKVCNSEQCIVFEEKGKSIKIKYGLLAGVSFNSIDFGGEFYTDYGIGSLIGCKFEFSNLFFSSEHSCFQIELILQKLSNYTLNITRNYDIDKIRYNGNDYYKSSYPPYPPLKNINIKTIALKMPITYNYMFVINKFRPYIGGGMTFMYILSQNNELKVSQFVNEYGESIPLFHYGFIGNIGTKYKLNNKHFLFFEIAYEFTQNNQVTPMLRFRNKNYSIVSGFTF